MTIPQRILVHVALGASLVIAVATAVTYEIVFEAAKRRDLQHLATYVTERARREAVVFRQIEANMLLVRGQFLKRMGGRIPADLDTKWNARFELFPDGSWRSKTNFWDGRTYSTLWAHRESVLTPELKVGVLRAQDICDELLPGWVDTFPSVYFVMSAGPAWLNVGFDPRIPNWVWETPADYNAANLEWFHLAMPSSVPRDEFRWTGVIEEPTTKVPIVSVYVPLFLEGRLIGSLGHDEYVNRMMEEITRSDLPGARHVIFRGDGRIVAHPTKLREILASKGQLTMQDCGEPELAELYSAVVGRVEAGTSRFDETTGCYYSAARLVSPDWYILTTMPRELLRRQAFESAQWVLWSALVSLALLLAFLAVTLRRQIASPLAELMHATQQMSGGDISARAVVRQGDELGELAGAFNEMAARVAEREAQLRHLNLDLEKRVETRTGELREANESLTRAREEALRLLAKEKELSELKSNFVALVSHEFRTPLEIILSSVDNLDRYHDRLPAEKRHQLLKSIHKAVRRMAGMMEEVLVLGRLETDRVTFKDAPLDLAALCRRLVDEIESAMNRRCPIDLHLPENLDPANGDESLLRHIFTNLLSNAVKYSPGGQSVEFTVSRSGDRAIVVIADRGCGIPTQDRQRVFQAFHRGTNVGQIPGTGLGLMIVRRCVEMHGGEISFESIEGQGTAFTVTLPLFGSGSQSGSGR